MIAECMPQDEYRSADGINVSAYRYFWQEDGQKIKHEIDTPFKGNAATDYGTLVHTAILEPDLLEGTYAVWDASRRTNKYKEFAAENSDKLIVTTEQLASLPIISQNLKDDAESMRLLRGCDSEVSMFWELDSGAKCKGRLDVAQKSSHIIADIKTMRVIRKGKFWRDAFDNGLHIQAGHYAEGYRRCFGIDHNPSWWFICIESVAPYRVVSRPISPEALEYGRIKNNEIVNKIHIGNVTGAWSTLAQEEGIQEGQLPEWYKQEEEWTI